MIRTMVFTALFICTGLSSIWAAPITHVQVQVSSVQEAVPPLVQKRIAASIQTVGNHVLLNQDSRAVDENKESYKRVMYDIVNRVLIGYTVDDIQIAGDSTADVTIKIRPWGQTIQSVQMDVDYGALPEWSHDCRSFIRILSLNRVTQRLFMYTFCQSCRLYAM